MSAPYLVRVTRHTGIVEYSHGSLFRAREAFLAATREQSSVAVRLVIEGRVWEEFTRNSGPDFSEARS